MPEYSALVLQLTGAEHLVRGDDVPCAVLAAGHGYGLQHPEHRQCRSRPVLARPRRTEVPHAATAGNIGLTLCIPRTCKYE